MYLNVSEGQQNLQTFFFEPIPQKALDSKQAKQVLTKWGLADSLKIGSFRFSQPFNEFYLDNFLQDLFSNPNLRYIINNVAYPADTVTKVNYTKLKCTQLSTEMFDNLSNHGVVTGESIQKTYGDQFEGIEICDRLRECLLLQESELYEIFSADERKQLLLRLFQILVIGGSLNQYEDTINAYLEWTKVLYKSVVTVRKKADSEHIFIDSLAVEVTEIQSDGFKKDNHPQNILFVIVCPSLRIVHVVANKWTKFW